MVAVGFLRRRRASHRIAEREALEEAGARVRVTGYHWIDEYAPGSADGGEPQYCAVSYYHAVPVEEPAAVHDGAEVSEVTWFATDELPRELAPPGETGRRQTPLPDRS